MPERGIFNEPMVWRSIPGGWGALAGVSTSASVRVLGQKAGFNNREFVGFTNSAKVLMGAIRLRRQIKQPSAR